MNQSGFSALNTQSDEELMLQFQSGRDEAFNNIVQRYQPRLYNYLIRYTRNHEDTEDLVQETFLRLYRSRNAYEPVARFSTWLFTIAGNLMRTQFRKHNRWQLSSIDDNSPESVYTPELPCLDAEPDTSVNSGMVLSLIEKVLHSMPEDYRSLLLLRELNEMSYEEIALASGLPMGTVKSRINRGRLKAQEIFREMQDESLIYAA
jgi:RNA polymerase sigma-70 factor (ECF subfamily)